MHSYKDDKIQFRSAYSVPQDTEAIQKEIMQSGSVQVAMNVFADFLLYKEGVYRHVDGKELGGHSIKMIGWGSEGGVDYWLCTNSWNTDWRV